MPLKEMTIVDLREEMALRALNERYTVSEVAEMFQVSKPTVRLWRDRYRTLGRPGLEDRSHAAHRCPHRTDETVEQLIVAERERWPHFGSKKILNRLTESHPDLRLPKRSTVDAILARHNLVRRTIRRKRELNPTFIARYDASEPGELTTIDYKGQFRLANGQYCFPLTLVDSVSRFILACEALPSPVFAPTWRVITRVFSEYGLPFAMHSDNGPPFGPTHGRFSIMSVRLMTLDILPVFSRPGRPGDNGRHERMHRDLKEQTVQPPARNLLEQQLRFDRFRLTYNQERPHEGINMQRPARAYKVSHPRPVPNRPPKPDYPGWFDTRRVARNGAIGWNGRDIFISRSLGGHYVGLEPIDDGILSVHFHRFVIGKIDEREHDFL